MSNYINTSINLTNEKIKTLELQNIKKQIQYRSFYLLKKKFEKYKEEIAKIISNYKDINNNNITTSYIPISNLKEIINQIQTLSKFLIVPYEKYSELLTADLMSKLNKEKSENIINNICGYAKENIEKFNAIFYDKRQGELKEEIKKEKEENNNKEDNINKINNEEKEDNGDKNKINNTNEIVKNEEKTENIEGKEDKEKPNDEVKSIKQDNEQKGNSVPANTDDNKEKEKEPIANKNNNAEKSMNNTKSKIDPDAKSKKSENPLNKTKTKIDPDTKSKKSENALNKTKSQLNADTKSKISEIQPLPATTDFEEPNKQINDQPQNNNNINEPTTNNNNNNNKPPIEEPIQKSKYEDELNFLITILNSKIFLFSDTIPLILAEFLQNNPSICLIDLINEFPETKTLFDNEILEKLNELKKIDPNEEKAEVVKNLLYDQMNIDNTIKEYNQMYLDKSSKGENVNNINNLINKLKEQKTLIRNKINILNGDEQNNITSPKYVNNNNNNNLNSINTINSLSKKPNNYTPYNNSNTLNKNNTQKNIHYNSTQTPNNNNNSISINPNNNNNTQHFYVSKIIPRNQMTKSELRKQSLLEIFYFYSRQHKLIGKKSTFDNFKNSDEHLDLSEFLKFCREFKVLAKNNMLVSLFKEVSSNSRELSFDEFFIVLQRISIMVNEEKMNYLKEKINNYEEVLNKMKGGKDKSPKKNKGEKIFRKNNGKKSGRVTINAKSDKEKDKVKEEIGNDKDKKDNQDNQEKKDKNDKESNKESNKEINKEPSKEQNKEPNKETNKDTSKDPSKKDDQIPPQLNNQNPNPNQEGKNPSSDPSTQELQPNLQDQQNPNPTNPPKNQNEIDQSDLIEKINQLKQDYDRLSKKTNHELQEEFLNYLEVDNTSNYRSKMIGFVVPFNTREINHNIVIPNINNQNLNISLNNANIIDILNQRKREKEEVKKLKEEKEKEILFEKKKNNLKQRNKILAINNNQRLLTKNYKLINEEKKDYIKQKNNEVTWEQLNNLDYSNFLLEGQMKKNDKVINQLIFNDGGEMDPEEEELMRHLHNKENMGKKVYRSITEGNNNRGNGKRRAKNYNKKV